MAHKADRLGNLTALLAGIFLFMALFGELVDMTLFKEQYHAALFQHNRLDAYARFAAENSVKQLKAYIEESSPKFITEYQGFFDMLTKSITPEMVEKNLNSIRRGLFRYFQGDTYQLPDLYFSPAAFSVPLSLSQDTPVLKAAAALGSVDHINLDAILLYTGRSDIMEHLQEIRLLFLVFSRIPVLMFGAGLLLSLVTLTSFSGSNRRRYWTVQVFTTCGTMLLLTSLSLGFYTLLLLPGQLYPLEASVPLPGSLVLQYTRDALYPVIILAGLSGLVFLASAHYQHNSTYARFRYGIPDAIHTACGTGKSGKLVPVFLILMSAMALLYGTSRLAGNFHNEGLRPVAEKLLHPYQKTQVIAAADQNLYLLRLTVREEGSGIPVSGIRMRISGHSSLSAAEYQVELQTDDQGAVKVYLDRGTYRLSFPLELFPEAYAAPSSFFFDLKTPGVLHLDIPLQKKLSEQGVPQDSPLRTDR